MQWMMVSPTGRNNNLHGAAIQGYVKQFCPVKHFSGRAGCRVKDPVKVQEQELSHSAIQDKFWINKQACSPPCTVYALHRASAVKTAGKARQNVASNLCAIWPPARFVSKAAISTNLYIWRGLRCHAVLASYLRGIGQIVCNYGVGQDFGAKTVLQTATFGILQQLGPMSRVLTRNNR
jgi:hypothetical protein